MQLKPITGSSPSLLHTIFIEDAPEITKHQWSIQKTILAYLVVNSKERTFSISHNISNHFECLPILIARINTVLKRILYLDNQKVPLSDLEILFKQVDSKSPIHKELVVKWLENGGDPNAVLTFPANERMSLITSAFQLPGLDLMQCFLTNLADPYCAYITKNKVASKVTLAHLAVIYKRPDILALLIHHKVRINDSVPFEGKLQTPLRLALHYQNADSISILTHYVDKVFPELNLSPSIDNPDYVKKFAEHIQLRNFLGHRFGISLKELDTGLGFKINLSTEGSGTTLRQDFKNSIHLFFKKNPHLEIPNTKGFIERCLSTNLTPATAPQLIDDIANNLSVGINCRWPGHDAWALIHEQMVFVCNRGGYREKETVPGIQVYGIANSNRFTDEVLLEIQNSPTRLIDPNERIAMGLAEEIVFEFNCPKQPGGFCVWDNAKLFFHLVLAIAESKKDVSPNGPQLNYINFLVERFLAIEPLFKAWTKFDRELAVEKTIQFYENNPSILPDIPLLLFVLANYKGDNSRLVSFLSSQTLTNHQFLTVDTKGKNLFHHLSHENNLAGLSILLDAHKKPVFDILINCSHSGKSPLQIAIDKHKFKLAAALIEEGASFDDRDKVLLNKEIFMEKSLTLVNQFEKLGHDFTTKNESGWTGLHFAICYKATECVDYFLTMKREMFIKTVDELKDYLKFANSKENKSAVAKLNELTRLFNKRKHD